MINEFEEVCTYLPERLRGIFSFMSSDIKSNIQEIRVNVSAPIRFKSFGESFYINTKGNKTTFEKGVGIFSNEMEDIFFKICDSSIYAHEGSLKQGFVTLKGGHRVGIGATAVIKDEKITSVKNISSLNFRISHDFEGCSNEVMNYILKNEKVFNSFILSPPSGGKTTLIRDISRTLSQKGKTVCVIDERSEISGNFGGISKYNLYGCDILNGYPKQIGIIQALRTMSPDVIVCDELGTLSEAEEVLRGMNSGVSFILTAHAGSIEEARKRQAVKLLLTEFDHAVILCGSNSPGKVKKVEELC